MMMVMLNRRLVLLLCLYTLVFPRAGGASRCNPCDPYERRTQLYLYEDGVCKAEGCYLSESIFLRMGYQCGYCPALAKRYDGETIFASSGEEEEEEEAAVAPPLASIYTPPASAPSSPSISITPPPQSPVWGPDPAPVPTAPTLSPTASATPFDDLMDAVRQSRGLSVFETMLENASLDTFLETQDDITVFAPTDDAFGALDQNYLLRLLEPGYRQHLDNLLRFHIQPSAIFESEFSNDSILRNDNGERILVETLRTAFGTFVTLSGVAFMASQIVQADVEASNGLLHKVNAVFLPSFTETDLFEVAQSTSSLSILVELISLAGLEETIRGGSYTLLAPSDSAFENLPAGSNVAYLKDPANREELRDMLLYHVLVEVLPTDLVVNNELYETAPGGSNVIATLDQDQQQVVFNNVATVTVSNVLATNGLVHVIDTVLQPSNNVPPVVTAAPIPAPTTPSPINTTPTVVTNTTPPPTRAPQGTPTTPPALPQTTAPAPVPAPTTSPVQVNTPAPVASPPTDTIAPTPGQVDTPTPVPPTDTTAPTPGQADTPGPTPGQADTTPAPTFGEGVRNIRICSEDSGTTNPDTYSVCLDLYIEGSDQQYFVDAVDTWEGKIVGDLSDFTPPGGSSSFCGGTYPPVIDDMYICGQYAAIDGSGGVIAVAGPDQVRNGDLLPYEGTIQIDEADLSALRANGGSQYSSIVQHEIGHAFGFGPLWDFLGLAAIDGSTCSYSGVNANREWAAISGCDSQVPVPNEGFCFHWDESCLGNEIMTGTVSSGATTKFSAITLGALEDLGYQVDYSQADDFGIDDLGSCACGRRLDMKNSTSQEEGEDNGGRRGTFHLRSQSRLLFQNAEDPPQSRPRASQIMEDYARLYGLEFLRQRRQNRLSKPVRSDEDGIDISDRFASVVFLDEGNLFSLPVWGDGEGSFLSNMGRLKKALDSSG